MGDTEKDESHEERLDRELMELLNELRVALPGVQVLFAFLLTLPFTGRFGELTHVQRDVFFGTFSATTAATAFLLTPTAFHRLRWRRYDKERLLRLGNVMAILGLTCLALSLGGAAFLVTDMVFGTWSAAAIGAMAAALIGGLWFAYPLSRRVRKDRRR